MRGVTLAVLLALVVPAAFAQEFRITRPEIEHAEGVDFGSFQRYAWKSTQDPGSDEAAHATLVFDIDGALAAAGLRKAETAAEAQLLVRYYTSFEKRVRSTASQERVIAPDNQRTSVGFSRAIEGTLVIELYDAADGGRLWRGSTRDVTSRERFSDDQVRRAVDLILGEYPPDAGSGKGRPKR
jgi:hypothetical protein